jgi:hypothetical protein
MSQQRSYPITCPQCKTSFDADLYDAVNVSENAELKELLLVNKLNLVVCPNCEFNYRVDKNLLYNDPDNHLLIYLMSADLDELDVIEDEFLDSMATIQSLMPDNTVPPDVQLVIDRNELVERIFLQDNGLDERIIEHVKYIIYSRNLERLPPDQKRLLFNAQDSDDDNLVFVVQDVESSKLEGVLQFGRDAYVGMLELMEEDEKSEDMIRALFPGPYCSARVLLLQEAGASTDET